MVASLLFVLLLTVLFYVVVAIIVVLCVVFWARWIYYKEEPYFFPYWLRYRFVRYLYAENPP
ncbi:MAG TPA: hypothetical protein VM324_03280 [Egibacteraceae bacterium]|jgi:uncharacterized membrane protein (UPF0182 family)|nr:hypothetical protein [Egibacteraceae bacterium]